MTRARLHGISFENRRVYRVYKARAIQIIFSFTFTGFFFTELRHVVTFSITWVSRSIELKKKNFLVKICRKLFVTYSFCFITFHFNVSVSNKCIIFDDWVIWVIANIKSIYTIFIWSSCGEGSRSARSSIGWTASDINNWTLPCFRRHFRPRQRP